MTARCTNASAAMADWWAEVKAVDVLDAAEALGMQPANRQRGRSAVWHLPHGDCDGHGSGKPSVHYASMAGRLRCRACARTWDTLQLIAQHIGVELPEGGGWSGSTAVDQVRARAAELGWCLPDEQITQRQRDAWAEERRQRAARQQAEERARRAQREATGLDVTEAWSDLMRAEAGRQRVAAWAQHTRKLPAELLPHLPWLDLAAVPERSQHVGAAGAELLRIAQRRRRHILIAMRDGRGEVQSVRTRWHLPGAPPADPKTGERGGKALALASKSIRAGEVALWHGGVAVFGSLEVAIDTVLRGRELVLVEGGPDYVTAAALCAWARAGVAIGYPSDTAIARLADWLRAELRARLGAGAARPRIALVPHNDSGKRGDRGREAARAAQRALRWTADVRVVRLPLDQDLNDQATALGVEGLKRLVFGEALRPRARTYHLRGSRS